MSKLRGLMVSLLAGLAAGFAASTAVAAPELQPHDFAIKNTLPYYASIMKSAEFIAAFS